MQILMRYLAVGAAGSLGTILRLMVSTLCGRMFGTAFPIGTFLINGTGSLFLGWFLTVVSERVVVSDTFRLAVAVGFVGGYTTFSTFMFESNSLLQDGSGLKAMVNMLGSLFVGLLAVRVGIWLGSP
jgi:CrcB protein